MTGLVFTLVAVLLAGVGARDQITLAQLSGLQGGRMALLLTGVLTACLTAAFAAWAALAVMPMLMPNARLVLAAMALALAGAESLVFAPRRKPEEPTHSLGALAVVLLAHQLTDAARFLVFAIAVATAAPVSAGVGGAVGGALVVGLGWAVPGLAGNARLRRARRWIGALLVLIALVLAWRTLA